jgi:hypothetical protein
MAIYVFVCITKLRISAGPHQNSPIGLVCSIHLLLVLASTVSGLSPAGLITMLYCLSF